MAWSFRAARLAESSGADEIAHCSLLFSGAQGGGGGGGATTLTPWTITEQGGGAQSNIPVEIWVPFSSSTGTKSILSTDAIQVLDADGVTPLLVQEDNTSSDLAGDIRGKLITAILPALSSTQARQLTVQKVASTSPATGTDITTAEVIAAAGSDVVATMVHGNGTTYTASMNTALAASSWSAKTAAANQGKWRTGGGIVTEWICCCPFKNGGTAAPNNLMFWMSVSAYKAQRGAVTGGNPIIGIKIKYWVEGCYAQVTSGYGNDWYDLTVAAGSNSQSWVGSSPAKTLTLSANGGNLTTATATVSAGGTTFTPNSVGMTIADGTGQAVIVGYVSATQVNVIIVNSLSGTSIGSGSWRIYGISHGWAQSLPQQEIWYGGTPAISARPIDSTLGVAWAAGAGGPFSYLSACGMILPYSTAAASITHDVTSLDACGTNPMSWIKIGGGTGLPYAGDVFMEMPNPGGRPDIAPVPGFYVDGLIKHDANGKRKIFENAAKAALWPYNWRDQTTGKTVLLNNGTDYTIDRAWGNVLPQPDSYQSSGIVNSMTGWQIQDAHHPDLSYIPWLLTGDFFWVEQRQKLIFWTWAANNAGYGGSGLNRVFCTTSELRGNGWNFRDLALGIMMIPDRNPSPLGYTRSHLSTVYTNQFTAVNSNVPGTGPFPGINISLINNTGPGKVYATTGPREMSAGNVDIMSNWQLGYMGLAFFMIKAAGMLNSDAATFMSWFMQGLTGVAVDTNVNWKWMVPDYRFIWTEQNTRVYSNDWLGVYRNTANNPTQAGANVRNVTGSGITLSGLSGTGITVAMPSGYFNNGGASFYTGMIKDLNAASLVGSGAPITPSVSSTSASSALPANGGYVVVKNTGANTVYISLSIGAGTATTGDSALAAGANWQYRPDESTGDRLTYINYRTASGSSSLLIQPQGVNAGGTGYAPGDTITLTVADSGGNMTVTTRAVLTVVSAPGGVIESVQVTTPGVYTANTPGDMGSFGASATQFSTSGSGTGATFNNLTFRFGAAKITNVATNTLTLDTTAYFKGLLSDTIYCYPFAQTGLVSNKIQAPAPAVNDNDGSSSLGLSVSLPTPFSSYHEYWDIAQQCAFMAGAQGFTDGSSANTNIAAMYTGGSQTKWKVA